MSLPGLCMYQWPRVEIIFFYHSRLIISAITHSSELKIKQPKKELLYFSLSQRLQLSKSNKTSESYGTIMNYVCLKDPEVSETLLVPKDSSRVAEFIMKTARCVRQSLDKKITILSLWIIPGQHIDIWYQIWKQIERNKGIWKIKKIRQQEAKTRKKGL